MGQDALYQPHFGHTSPPRRRGRRPDLSVVVPLYNEQENVESLWSRLESVLIATGLSHEVVLVDDGSRDGTPGLIAELSRSHDTLVSVRLSRNFGHQPALTAGLEIARGRAVVVLDGDLQDPPELIPSMVALWNQGADVVHAVRRRRDESLFKRAAYHVFYRILARVSEIDIPLDSGDFCLMDRRVVDAMNEMPERCRFVRGLRSYLGFRQVGLPYDRPARAAGEPKYTMRALVRLAIDGLVSFSALPLRITTALGLSAAVLAMGLAGWAVNDALRHHTAPAGWASTLVIVLFLGAAQLLSLGVIGEYLRLIFLESKRRPPYVIAELTRGGKRTRARSAGEPMEWRSRRPRSIP